MKPYTLLELNGYVRNALRTALPETYWVQAEISSISQSGHCYLELVQKDESGRTFLAKAKANIWRSTWLVLKAKFEQATGHGLAVGMKVMLLVTVTFHEIYGYSLVVSDLDPTYTMGDMARRRREIIERLKADGVIDQNRSLELAVLPQRIAVVSSATAAGYGDFCNQLEGNMYGFVFYHKLFPALMQGDQVEASVISALDEIAARRDMFDAVVIIRGGGAVSELSCFDSYDLASNIANFPLPVITGIGHERDDTVCDLVSYEKVKTPTAAAEFLINKVYLTAMELEDKTHRLGESVSECMKREMQKMQLLSQKLPSLFAVLKVRQEGILDNSYKRIQTGMENMLTRQGHKLDLMEKSLQAADPVLVLRRGFSLTSCNGRIVRNAGDVKPGDVVVTRFHDGEVESEVK